MVFLFKNIFVLYIKLGLFKKIYNVNINDFLLIELFLKYIFLTIIFKNVIIFVLLYKLLFKNNIIYYFFIFIQIIIL
jgi:hypothetical protein